MNRHWILEPRHGFFAKDGRGWYAGASNRGNSLPWLHPPTLRGAICTAIGRELERGRPKVFAPSEWLALKDSLALSRVLALRAPVGIAFTPRHRMWPAPADAVHLASDQPPDRLVARRAKVALWDRFDDPRVQAMRLLALERDGAEADVKPHRGAPWWSEGEFVNWLCGTPHAGPTAATAHGRQPAVRNDVHVRMTLDSWTADPGGLWSNEFRETLTRTAINEDADTEALEPVSVFRWAFAFALASQRQDAAAARPSTATLAGDRHLASVLQSEPLDEFPALLGRTLEAERTIPRLRLFAVTPTVFNGGWCPDGFSIQGNDLVGSLPGITSPVRLLAAAVGRPVPLSGWDLAAPEPNATSGSPGGRLPSGGGAPRTTRLACPPGSMWLVQKLEEASFSPSEVQSLWLSAWGEGTAEGLGTFVAGLDPAPTARR